MKAEVYARFVPTHHKGGLFNKLQQLKQGTKTCWRSSRKWKSLWCEQILRNPMSKLFQDSTMVEPSHQEDSGVPTLHHHGGIGSSSHKGRAPSTRGHQVLQDQSLLCLQDHFGQHITKLKHKWSKWLPKVALQLLCIRYLSPIHPRFQREVAMCNVPSVEIKDINPLSASTQEWWSVRTTENVNLWLKANMKPWY
jgi:hypothetical protein